MEDTIAALARDLRAAELAQVAIEPLSERFPSLTARDAYAIQEAYAHLRLEEGAALVGRKIGATSQAIQDLFQIDTPDYGHIFSDMVSDNGEIVADTLIQPLVEPELAFVFDRELRGPGVTREIVLDAVVGIAPCLEVIDSRIRDWAIAYVDTVADNGSSARCVFGELIDLDNRDLATVTGTMLRNSSSIGTATGAAVLGHPAESVAWLANELGRLGSSLREGEWVLSGSLMTAVPAVRGDTFEAVFDANIGSVSCRFV